MAADSVIIERGGRLHKGEEVYGLVAYDTSIHRWWMKPPLVAIRCHPKQGARWVDGKPTKAEREKVLAALAKLKPEVPNA